MRALVTGGAGLIGSHIADLLFEKGFKVRILDNLEKETHTRKPRWIKKEYEFVKGDVGNKKTVASALKNVDYVFHQAAYGGFSPEITKFIRTNSIGTANIFEAIKENKYKIIKIVVASSMAVYGEGKYKCRDHGTIEPEPRKIKQLEKGQWELKCPHCEKNLKPLPTDERKRIDPRLIYSLTKYDTERMALIAGRALGVPTVALRYSLTYGPRQSLINPYTGITSIFSTRLLNGSAPLIYENGKQTRDFTYVEDVASANYLVSQTNKSDYQVFNVSTGKPTTIMDFALILNTVYQTNIKPKVMGKFRLGDVRHIVLDNSKLRKLGWSPKTNVAQGIENYANWIKSQGNLKKYFEKATNIAKSR